MNQCSDWGKSYQTDNKIIIVYRCWAGNTDFGTTQRKFYWCCCFLFCCFNPSWLVAKGTRWSPPLPVLNTSTEKRSIYIVSYKITLSDLGLRDLPWGLVEKRNEGSRPWYQAAIHSPLIGKQKKSSRWSHPVPLRNAPLRLWLRGNPCRRLPTTE